MAGLPEIERHGDAWSLAWHDKGVAIGFDGLKDHSDGLKAEVTVESTLAGRVIGPVTLNILAMQSQQTFSKRCHERVNSLPREEWDQIVIYACGIVAKQYRAPSPTVRLNRLTDLGPVEFLVPGLIPIGETTFVYGDGESCKSLIAQRIGISVVTGAPLPWGDRPSRTTNVLICDWETNERTVGLRVSRLCLGLGVPVPEILYRGTLRSVQAPPLRYLEDEVPALREQIQREQIGLVIVDSLSFAVRGKLVDDDVARQAIYDLRQLGPATRLVVAHVSKDAAHSVGGRVDPFGSAFFRNGLRSGFEVRKTEDQHSGSVIDLGVFQHKNNDAEHMRPFGVSVHFEGNAGAIEIVQQDIQAIPDLASRTSVSSRLRALLMTGSRTIEQLSETTGEKESTIRKTLNRMSDVTNLNPGRGGAGNRAMWGLRERNELPG